MNQKKSIKKGFFTKDSGKLFVSVLLALVLWFLLKMSQEYTHSEEVQIKYNIPSTKILVNTPPSQIRAEFSGSGWNFLLQGFSRVSKSIQIDLASNNSQAFGSGDLVNYIKNCNYAENFTVNKVDLNLLQIELEDKKTKLVPVLLSIDATPIEQGYTLTQNIEISPDSVLVSAPSNYLSNIVSIEPFFGEIAPLNTSGTILVELQNPNPNITNLSINSVKIKFEIQQLIEKTVFVPIIVINGSDSIEIFPSTIKVTSNVPMNQFNAISASDYYIEADFSSRNNNTIPLILKSSPKFSHDNTLEITNIEYLKVH